MVTNELDKEELSAEELLRGYEGQVQVEHGFRYPKDRQLLAGSLCLHGERRIAAPLITIQRQRGRAAALRLGR